MSNGFCNGWFIQRCKRSTHGKMIDFVKTKYGFKGTKGLAEVWSVLDSILFSCWGKSLINPESQRLLRNLYLKEEEYTIAISTKPVYTDIEPSLKLVFPISTLSSVALPSWVSF